MASKALRLRRRPMMLGAAAALVTLGGLLFIGCGGGGGSSAPISTARAVVQLPQGVAIAPASLQAQTVVSSQPVTSSGSFTAQLSPGGLGLVQMVNSAGKVVMLGFVDPSASTGNVVSPTSTAIALLYFELGGFMLPPDHLPSILPLIAQQPQTAQLAATVSSRMAADPTAVGDGDAQLYAAVQQAANSILPAGGRAIGPKLTKAATFKVVVQKSGRAPQPLVLVQPNPGTQQSGVQVQIGSGTSIFFTNNFRRHCEAFIYETGTVSANDSSGTLNPVSPPDPQNGGQPITIPATQALGTLNLLGDVVTGKAPWTPVNSQPFTLDLAPGTVKTVYEIVVIGPTLNLTDNPPVFSDPQFAAFGQQWKSHLLSLDTQTFLEDFLVPLIGAVMNVRSGLANIAGVVPGWITWMSQFAPASVQQVQQGDWEGAAQAAVQVLANSDLARTQAAQIMKPLIQQQANASNLIAGASQYVGALKLINAFFSGADVAAVVHDLAISSQGETWTATVFQPNVKLSPATATVDLDTPIVTLTTQVPGQSDLSGLKFTWQHTGTVGTLKDSNGNAIPLGTPTSLSAVDFVEGTTAVVGQQDTVQVTVTDPSNNITVGTAQSVVMAGAGACGGNSLPSSFHLNDPGNNVQMSVTSPDFPVVHSGDQVTVTVTLAQNIQGAGASINGPPASSITLDGQPVTSGPAGVTIAQSPSGKHTVVFTVSKISSEQCPVLNSPFTGVGLPDIGGPWVQLTAAVNNGDLEQDANLFQPYILEP